MKCTIKNMSPQSVNIFARINGADGRIEIGSGKEVVADNFETIIMQIYKKKGLITVTPLVADAEKVMSTMEEVVNPNNDEVLDKLHTTESMETIVAAPLASEAPGGEQLIVSSTNIQKTLQEVKDEVEQYVEDGYIKGAWSEEDISFLKKNYPTKGRKYCSNSLNRNESSVQKKINSMGLKKKKKKK